MTPPIHIICGATASGKSARAMQMAAEVSGVIINADSQQLYHELRILTARPTLGDEAAVPHRLYGALAGDDPASVAKWLRLAAMEIDWALAEGLTPIVVGGTGLYLKALTEGIAEIPDVPEAVRAQAESDYADMGGEAFHARLAAVDPELTARVFPTDPQRMIRGWSVWLATAKPLTYWQNTGNKPLYDRERFQITHVEMEREALYDRCNQRVEQMIGAGAIEEVRGLLACGYPDSLPVMRIIGVPEISAHLGGDIPLDEAVTAIKQATRHYAKRQMTWFRHQLPPAS